VIAAIAVVGAFPGTASAYTAQVEASPAGFKFLHVFTSDTQATADSFEGADVGGNRMRFTGSDTAVAGTGCTGSGRSVTCEVESLVFVDVFAGADRVVVQSAPRGVVVFGGAGDDDIRVPQAPFSDLIGFSTGILGDEGDDVIVGSAGPDLLDGREGDDVIAGNKGDDSINSDLGGDVMSGGAGVDQVTYLIGTDTPRGIGITVHVGDGVCNDGNAEDDAVGSRPPLPANVTSTCGRGNAVERDEVQGDIESILGTDGPDSIIGAPSDGTITGLAGEDLLEGGQGADSLIGEGTFPGAFLPTTDGDDTLLLRDGVTDFSSSCGAGSGDRAVADPDDPVNPDCETVERGAAGVTGPPSDGFANPIVVGGDPNPNAPQQPQPITTPPPPPGSPPTGTETGGTGPGGGDDGATPPDVRIFGDTLIVDRQHRAQVRITCVYRAEQCKGTAELTATKDIGKGRKGIDKGDRAGRTKIAIPWGRTGRVPVKVSKSFVAALGDGSTKLKLAVEARDSGAGAAAKVARVSRKMTTELQG
jgi:Ca2+-binding RTX toxin-like protein